MWLFLQIIFTEKTCFQNKSKFTTEDQFTKYMNITAEIILIKLNLNEIIYKR